MSDATLEGDVPRVVILDPIRADDWTYATDASIIEAAGGRLVVPADDAAADEAIEVADVVVVSGIRRLDASRVASLRRAVGILCYSIGMNQVDTEAATARGIPVRNVPGYCVDEVADHALTLLLASWRRLVPLAARAGAGDWAIHDDPRHRAIRRLRGSTLGIVGAGRIGQGVGRRARAFGMRTIAADPYAVATDPDLPIVSLDEVLADADGLVLCAALTPETRGLIGEHAFASIKPGLVFVNVARGGLVDERALAAALRDGRVAVAGLDVRDPEPPIAGNDPLAGLEDVVVTPHIAASSREAVEDLHRMAAETCVELLRVAGRLPGRDLAGAATERVA